jgi:hypothetical protein
MGGMKLKAVASSGRLRFEADCGCYVENLQAPAKSLVVLCNNHTAKDYKSESLKAEFVWRFTLLKSADEALKEYQSDR